MMHIASTGERSRLASSQDSLGAAMAQIGLGIAWLLVGIALVAELSQRALIIGREEAAALGSVLLLGVAAPLFVTSDVGLLFCGTRLTRACQLLVAASALAASLATGVFGYPPSALGLVALFVFVSATAEESVFRYALPRWLIGRLAQLRLSDVSRLLIAHGLSAVLFALAHLIARANSHATFSVYEFLRLVSAALLYSVVARRFSLAAAIAVHAVLNYNVVLGNVSHFAPPAWPSVAVLSAVGVALLWHECRISASRNEV